MRSFFCLELPESVKREISEIPGDIETPAYVKWVSRNNLHITLKFLGDVDKGEIPELKRKAKKSVDDIDSFKMTIDKLSGFPHPGFPKVIWLGSDSPPDEIFRLHESLEAEMSKLGFDREERDYVPHVTLGRTKDENDSKIENLGSKLKGRELESSWSVPINKLTLMESNLKPDGPVYDPVFQLDLRK